MINLAWAIPLLPLLAFVAIAFVTRRSPHTSGLLSVGAVLLSFLAALAVFADVLGGASLESSFTWLAAGEDGFQIGITVDPLAAVMLVVVTTVSLLVQVYSHGYMHGDPGYSRYFASLSLFTFSMLGLVLGSSLLAIFIFWELVGLCSYLLIGHWYHKPEAAAAAKKAFVVTRFGDFGFLVGLLYIYLHAGTLNIVELRHLVETGALSEQVLTVGSLLLFAGAVGKSAQFPLHVWLPDAMEGPTPVSALIHAATMVAAGVYLVARTFFMFEHAPLALTVVAFIGGFTAIFAATMGLVNNDIKRVLAYSTVSQLGYMMLALGAGALAAGMFHLFTHAFFKALLFLAAGSVIHAAHTQDIREMGGLGRAMPWTALTMIVAALSLAGVPPLSGFWSKDEILVAVTHMSAPEPLPTLLYVFAVATVFMTSFYMFRVVFRTFFGAYRGHGHPHESPAVMVVPLVILAVPSVVVGFWNAPFVGGFSAFLGDHHVPEFNPAVAGISVVLGLAGIALAWLMYGVGVVSPERMGEIFRPFYVLFYRKYWIDELYYGIVNAVVVGGAQALAVFDRVVVDGVVNGVARGVRVGGLALRRVQTGQVQAYAWVFFAGVMVIALAVLLPTLG